MESIQKITPNIATNPMISYGHMASHNICIQLFEKLFGPMTVFHDHCYLYAFLADRISLVVRGHVHAVLNR